MAGTCDEPTPAMILATAYFRFAVLRLAGLDFGLLDFWLLLALALAAGFFVALFAVFFAAPLFASPPERNAEGLFLPVRERLPSTERPPLEHHVGVILLGGPRHGRRQMLERVAVGGAELGGEIDVAAEFQHAVVIALEHRVGLLRRQLEFLQILRLVRLEGPAVLVLHQRHAEHVDAIALARAVGIEHESARDIVIFALFAGHRRHSHLVFTYIAQQSLATYPSCPALCRASTSLSERVKDVDGRDKPGHDETENSSRRRTSSHVLQDLREPFRHIEHDVVAAGKLINAPILGACARQRRVEIRVRVGGRADVGLFADAVAGAG